MEGEDSEEEIDAHGMTLGETNGLRENTIDEELTLA